MGTLFEFLPLLIIIGILVGGLLLGLLGYGLFRMRQEAIEAAFRQEMLRAGMSIDDIIRVLQASRPVDLHIRSVELAHEENLKQAELKLKREMVERGMSAEDIVRVLKASAGEKALERPPEPMSPEQPAKPEQDGPTDYFARK
jgi:predicted RND superfamily exporter protein